MKRLLRWTAICLCAFLLFAGTAAFAEETEEEDPMATRLSDARSEIATRRAGYYGMVPIYGRDIRDGTYEIHVDSSSPYFRIARATLTVDGDEMTARFTIPSTSYLYVYPGTKKEASNADRSTWIECEKENDQTTFTFPVPALNAQLDCAAYSKGRKRWYSRTLVFDAASLPEDVLSFDLPDYELIETAVKAYAVLDSDQLREQREKAAKALEAAPIDMVDGEYSIEVNMTGGSGRASISSPTLLIVRDGKAYARLLWSSVYYDYMIVDGVYFYNLTEDGGPSTFEIPITVIDEPMPIVADTTAMGEPVEIEYVLTFYAETVGDKGLIPQESAKLVLLIAAAIIVPGGVLNCFIKKKRDK